MLTSPAAAAANVLHVAEGGSDAGGNTCQAEANPCATITYALTQAGPTPTFEVVGTIVDNIVPDRAITISGLDAPAGSPAVLNGNNAGPVINTGWSLTLRGLTVTGGVSPNSGGGLSVGGQTTVLDRVTVTGNKAVGYGGGILGYTNLTINDSVISNNTANYCSTDVECGGGLDLGGGLYMNSGSMHVTRTSVTGNTVGTGQLAAGGGIAVRDIVTSYSIVASTISGNTAPHGGGGLSVPALTSGTIKDSTISGNSSGIATSGGFDTLTMTGTTVTGNTGTGVEAIGAGAVRAAGSIVSGNGTDCWLRNPANFATGGYNLLGGSCTSTTTDVTGVAASLGALAANGGPTSTRLPLPGSAAIGKIPTGTSAFGTTLCARKDQRGVAAPASGQTSCTIGAAEVGAGVAPTFTSVASASVPLGSTIAFQVVTSGATPTLSVSSGTPLPAGVTFTDNRDGTGTLAGPAPAIGAHPFTLVANNGIGGNQTQAFTLTVTKLLQAPLVLTSVVGVAGTPLPLTTSGGSGAGAITYAVANGTASGCTVSGGSLSATSAGTCTVTATKAGDATYQPRSSAPTAVAFKLPQATLTVTSLNGVVGSPLTLTHSGGTGSGAVTYTVVNGTATGCTIASGKLTATGAGTCTVTATKAGDATHVPTSSVPTPVTLKTVQATLTVTSTTGTAGTPLVLTTGGGSGSGAVTYAAANGTATGCTIASGRLTVTGAGTCSVTATKAADPTHLVASSVPTTVTFVKRAQAITFTSSAPSGAVIGGPAYQLSATGGGSGNPVTFTLDAASTGCTLSGSTVVLAAAGQCVVAANQAGNATYLPAQQVQQSFAIAREVTSTKLAVRKIRLHGTKYWRFNTSVRAATTTPTGAVVIQARRAGHKPRVLCRITLSEGAGRCRIKVAQLHGVHVIVAKYLASAAHQPSSKTLRRRF